MNQEQLLAKRDELVQEPHLGELELYRTPMTARGRAIYFGAPVAFIAVVVALYQTFTGHAISESDWIVVIASIFLVLILFYVIIALQNRTYVYAYTSGLVCFRGSKGRVIPWDEISKVWIQRNDEWKDTLIIDLNDYTRIKFPNFSSRGSASDEALKKFIEEKMRTRRAFPHGE